MAILIAAVSLAGLLIRMDYRLSLEAGQIKEALLYILKGK